VPYRTRISRTTVGGSRGVGDAVGERVGEGLGDGVGLGVGLGVAGIGDGVNRAGEAEA
jgi:hypothetical protein